MVFPKARAIAFSVKKRYNRETEQRTESEDHYGRYKFWH